MCRYERRNVECLDSVRKYHQDIPPFLVNRPRHFLDHCLQRMPPSVSTISRDSISDDGSGVFRVRSADSDNTYTVQLSVPACSCIDWQRHHLPCKHMLAVFAACRSSGWESLPAAYRNFPHWRLDPDIDDSVYTGTTPHVAANSERIDDTLQMSVNSQPGDAAPEVSVDSQNIDAAPALFASSATQMSVNSQPVDVTPEVSVETQNIDAASNVSTDSSGAVSQSTLKLQSRLRQLMQVVSSYSYRITDASMLLGAIAVATDVVTKFKAAVPRLLTSHVNSRRRFAKASVQATYLNRRLHVIRAKRALRRKLRRRQGLSGMSVFLEMKHRCRNQIQVQ